MAKNDIVGFSRDAARRIVKTVREVDRLVQYRPRHQARYPVPTETPIIVAKITGGTNPYSAMQVLPMAGGDWIEKHDGITWSASGPNPLYERNDAEDIQADTIVQVWKAFVANDLSEREWVFDRQAVTPGTQLSITDGGSISTNQNNYPAPSTNALTVNATGAFSFTGFSGGISGRYFELVNTGSADITLPHESGSSSANQISTPTAGSWTVPPKASVLLKYLGGKWLIGDVPKIPGSHVSGTAGSPLTTKGDVYVHDGSADDRLPVGTDGHVLTADSGESLGVKWAAPAGGGGSVWRDGTGAPSSGLGVDGDYYLDDATGDVYLKASGSYSVVANIKGATGATGPPGEDGADGVGVPTGGETGQVLTKDSGTDYDTSWQDAPGSGGSGATLETSSGTTTDSYATIVDWTNAAGLWFSGHIENLDPSSTIRIRMSYTDFQGIFTSTESIFVSNGSTWILDPVWGGLTAYKLEAKSSLSGFHAAWDAKFSRLS